MTHLFFSRRTTNWRDCGWTGPASLNLWSHALAPVAELPVLEVVSAMHIVTGRILNGIKPADLPVMQP